MSYKTQNMPAALMRCIIVTIMHVQHVPHSWLPQTLACCRSLVQETSFTDSATNRWRNGFWDDSGSSCELLWPLLMDAEAMPHSAWITGLFEAGGKFQSCLWFLPFLSYHLLSSVSSLHLRVYWTTDSRCTANQRENWRACDLKETTKKICCDSWCCTHFCSGKTAPQPAASV